MNHIMDHHTEPLPTMNLEQQLVLEVLCGTFTQPVAWPAVEEHALKWTGRLPQTNGIRDWIIEPSDNLWGVSIIQWVDENNRYHISILYDDWQEGHLYEVASEHHELWAILRDLDHRITVANTVAAYRMTTRTN